VWAQGRGQRTAALRVGCGPRVESSGSAGVKIAVSGGPRVFFLFIIPLPGLRSSPSGSHPRLVVVAAAPLLARGGGGGLKVRDRRFLHPFRW